MTTALAGAGGFGKTTMARMVVHDPRIRAHFPDGILWIPLGESVQGAELADRIDNLCAGITGIKPRFTEPLAAGAALGAALGDRRFLLVPGRALHIGATYPHDAPVKRRRCAVPGPGDRAVLRSAGTAHLAAFVVVFVAADGPLAAADCRSTPWLAMSVPPGGVAARPGASSMDPATSSQSLRGAENDGPVRPVKNLPT